MNRQLLTRQRLLLCLVVFGLMGAGAVGFARFMRPPGTAVQWYTNLPRAQHEARLLGKPLFIDFFATWCGPCKMMDRDVYSDRIVADIMQHFVCVRLDVDLHREEAQRFGVSGIPRMIILDKEGDTVSDQVGYTGLEDGRQVIRNAFATTQATRRTAFKPI